MVSLHAKARTNVDHVQKHQRVVVIISELVRALAAMPSTCVYVFMQMRAPMACARFVAHQPFPQKPDRSHRSHAKTHFKSGTVPDRFFLRNHELISLYTPFPNDVISLRVLAGCCTLALKHQHQYQLLYLFDIREHQSLVVSLSKEHAYQTTWSCGPPTEP
eukprot:EG_transcript_37722